MANGYTTPGLIEAELRLSTHFSGSTYPSLNSVASWIEQESRLVEVRTGEVFSSTVVSSVLFDYDGGSVFCLPDSPVLSVDKVEYNVYSVGQASSWVELEEGVDKNFITYLSEGEIVFVPGVNRSVKVSLSSGNQRLRVSYTKGFSETPVEIEKLVTLLVAKRVIMSLASNQANTEGGSVQIGTIRITDPTSYGTNYVKNLNEEIDRLYTELGRSTKTFKLTRLY